MQNISLQTLIRIDAMAAFLSAVFVFFFQNWLADWLNLPKNTLHFMCIVSFCYAAYSTFLALQNEKSLLLIKILVFANGLWATVCIGIIVYHFGTINIFGILYLFAEAVFVGGLAFLEQKKI